MNFRYKNISAGYLGLKSDSANLNSSFFEIVFKKIDSFKERIIFPQRVPKSGYFEELYLLENTYFKEKFNKFNSYIDEKFLYTFEKTNNHCPSEENSLFNWINIILRYGKNKDILKFNIQSNNLPDEFVFEFQFMKEIAGVEVNLSNEDPISLLGLIKISEKIRNSNLDDWLKMRAMNRVIVYAYRHDKNNHKDLVNSYACIILEMIKLKKSVDFESHLLISFLYRGISMADCFDVVQKQKLLNISEEYARSLSWKTPEEKILYADNLCTFLQTMSKWNLSIHKLQEAENNLLEIISLDPFDSAAYTELGLFLFNIDRFKEASHYFKKAVNLGPAGVGMNAYFCAKCLEKIGNENEAIEAFYESTNLDPNALSPWLDLLELYEKNNDKEKVAFISNKIVTTSILKDQLEEEELNKISKLI